MQLPLIAEIYEELMNKNPNIRQELLVGEAKRRITLAMVLDVIEQTKKNIENFQIKTLDDVCNHKNLLVNFSHSMQKNINAIRNFLMQKMYRHPLVNDMSQNASNILNFLFDHHFMNPKNLPKERYELFLQNQNPKYLAEIICDYIAGMTDRFAIKCCNTIS